MPIAAFKWITVVLLILGSHAPSAYAQSTSGATERLHEDAMASFRQARFPEAYGRFIALANAGHAPSAELALWMYLHGAPVFARDWDCTQEQLTAWAQLAGQPVPVLVERSYPRIFDPVATRARGNAP